MKTNRGKAKPVSSWRCKRHHQRHGKMGTLDCPLSCREYSLLRNDDSSKVKGSIRGNTKIGPDHQNRYGIEIRIDSLSNDGSQSQVMINTGLNKYVTEMPADKPDDGQENHDDTSAASTGRAVAKVRPKHTSLHTSASQRTEVPFHRREWIDVKPGKFDPHAFEVAKRMNRLLRDDTTRTPRRRWNE